MAGIEKLTALKVSKTAKAGKYSDGKGLYLQVTKQLVKSWVFRYERGGSEHFMGLGPTHSVGLAEARDGRGLMLDISEWRPDHWAGHMLADLSSLSAHDATGNLVLLSDLTSALVEYSPEGAPISIMPLWAGWHGLQNDLPQAEGIAIGPDGDIFIVSEPNLFFRFRRSEDAAWMRR